MTSNDRPESSDGTRTTGSTTDAAGAPDRFSAGLEIDRLTPPYILSFLRGLPRRVAAFLPEEGGEDTDEGDSPPVEPDDLTAVADRLELLVDDLAAAGHPLNPRIDVTHPDVDVADADLAEAWRRILAGATEGSRRLAGIPASGWDEQGVLLASARQAVADLSWQLHRMEAVA
ncbi:MAG: hypothetical protein ACFCVK_00925 [Acidimicrobiales bacterium]